MRCGVPLCRSAAFYRFLCAYVLVWLVVRLQLDAHFLLCTKSLGESTLIAQLWREKHNESHMRDTRSRPPARNSHHFATFYGYWAAQQMQSMSFDPEKKQLSSHDIHSYEMNCKIIQINLASRCVHYYVCHQPYAMACYLLSRSTVHTFFRTRTEKCLETNVRCAISTVGIIILFTAHHTFTLR